MDEQQQNPTPDAIEGYGDAWTNALEEEPGDTSLIRVERAQKRLKTAEFALSQGRIDHSELAMNTAFAVARTISLASERGFLEAAHQPQFNFQVALDNMEARTTAAITASEARTTAAITALTTTMTNHVSRSDLNALARQKNMRASLDADEIFPLQTIDFNEYPQFPPTVGHLRALTLHEQNAILTFYGQAQSRRAVQTAKNLRTFLGLPQFGPVE